MEAEPSEQDHANQHTAGQRPPQPPQQPYSPPTPAPLAASMPAGQLPIDTAPYAGSGSGAAEAAATSGLPGAPPPRIRAASVSPPPRPPVLALRPLNVAVVREGSPSASSLPLIRWSSAGHVETIPLVQRGEAGLQGPGPAGAEEGSQAPGAPSPAALAGLSALPEGRPQRASPAPQLLLRPVRSRAEGPGGDAAASGLAAQGASLHLLEAQPVGLGPLSLHGDAAARESSADEAVAQLLVATTTTTTTRRPVQRPSSTRHPHSHTAEQQHQRQQQAVGPEAGPSRMSPSDFAAGLASAGLAAGDPAAGLAGLLPPMQLPPQRAIEVTVAVRVGPGGGARRMKAGSGGRQQQADDDSRAHYVQGPVCGLFNIPRYLEGRDCIKHGDRWLSRSQFEKVGGSRMAKWYKSIRVLPSLEDLEHWLERHNMPVLRGPSRRSSKRADEGGSGEPPGPGPDMGQGAGTQVEQMPSPSSLAVSQGVGWRGAADAAAAAGGAASFQDMSSISPRADSSLQPDLLEAPQELERKPLPPQQQQQPSQGLAIGLAGDERFLQRLMNTLSTPSQQQQRQQQQPHQLPEPQRSQPASVPEVTADSLAPAQGTESPGAATAAALPPSLRWRSRRLDQGSGVWDQGPQPQPSPCTPAVEQPLGWEPQETQQPHSRRGMSTWRLQHLAAASGGPSPSPAAAAGGGAGIGAGEDAGGPGGVGGAGGGPNVEITTMAAAEAAADVMASLHDRLPASVLQRLRPPAPAPAESPPPHQQQPYRSDPQRIRHVLRLGEESGQSPAAAQAPAWRGALDLDREPPGIRDSKAAAQGLTYLPGLAAAAQMGFPLNYPRVDSARGQRLAMQAAAGLVTYHQRGGHLLGQATGEGAIAPTARDAVAAAGGEAAYPQRRRWRRAVATNDDDTLMHDAAQPQQPSSEQQPQALPRVALRLQYSEEDEYDTPQRVVRRRVQNPGGSMVAEGEGRVGYSSTSAAPTSDPGRIQQPLRALGPSALTPYSLGRPGVGSPGRGAPPPPHVQQPPFLDPAFIEEHPSD